MQRFVLWFCVAACVLGICLGPALSRANSTLSESIVIEVAPNVLNLASDGSWVTVHTDIPYSEAVDAEVSLNGVDIAWSKADSRGYFVAKFVIGAVKDVVHAGDTATLELVVLTSTGDELVGTDTVKVIEVKGR